MFHTRLIVTLLMLGLTVASNNAWGEQDTKSLDQQLFDSLEDDLFSDLEPVPNTEPPDKADTPRSDVDRELQRELGGEDVGQQRSQNVLEKVVDAMRVAKGKLAGHDTAVATQEIQKQIVKDLDQLLAELQKQSQSKRGGSRQQSTSQSGGRPTGDQQVSSAQAGSQSPASQSTTRLGQADSGDVTPAEVGRLLDRAWGDLPAAVRQQMQSARPEKFLPKYSKLIEDYFRRLVEDQRDED